MEAEIEENPQIVVFVFYSCKVSQVGKYSTNYKIIKNNDGKIATSVINK